MLLAIFYNQPTNFFISFFIKNKVIIKASMSDIGTATNTPYNPKKLDNMKISGINKIHCLNKFKKLDSLTLPTA